MADDAVAAAAAAAALLMVWRGEVRWESSEEKEGKKKSDRVMCGRSLLRPKSREGGDVRTNPCSVNVNGWIVDSATTQQLNPPPWA